MMTVTRDIVKDLLPLYLAGEASADSRAAVESMLSTDAEIASLARMLTDDNALASQAKAAAVSRDRHALERTRRLLRRRSWSLTAAMVCTITPWTFAFNIDGVHFWLMRDQPLAGGLILAVAAVFWVIFATTQRQMRVSGL